MIKRLLIFLLTTIFLALIISTFLVYNKKTIITPYPYEITTSGLNITPAEIKEAENSNVLIVGDQMGSALTPYLKDLSDELNNNLKITAKIYNWSRSHEGIHRTIAKLKQLKKIPDIVIYHGASEELYEKKFNVQDIENIIKNFSYYDDDNIISLIMTFPFLSKFIYHDINYVKINNLNENRPSIDSRIRLKEKELSFFLYQYELTELYNTVKNKKSNLILLTTPINLLIAPKETCQIATTNSTIELQQEIEDDLKNGNDKKAYNDATTLSKESISNAKTFYLLGIAAKNIGEIQPAREYLSKAAIYDCINFRSNAIYNSIITKTSQKNSIHLIDFDALLSNQLTSSDSFYDELYPQNIYYQNLIKEIKENIKTLLSVKEH